MACRAMTERRLRGSRGLATEFQLTCAARGLILLAMRSKDWPLHDLTLKVLSLSKQIAFYEAFGLRLAEKNGMQAVLAAGDGAQVTLKALSNGRPRPPKTAGLFHFALLLPDRPSLGAFVRFVFRNPFRFVGAADHLVSESLYFSDEEGNGIEVYADRPRETWKWTGETVEMATIALDLEELASLPGPEWGGFPEGTRLGHMHLTIGNLDRSQEFYESMGLRQTLDWGAFRFLAWEGYHHHLAINLVEGRNAAPVSPEITGLESFSIRRDLLERERVDPSGLRLLL
jgi:catechol 2,3-dioxygenase